jgi:hypothetical protein
VTASLAYFKCAVCGDDFATPTTEAELEAEWVANGFGGLPDEEKVSVCDECYERAQSREELARQAFYAGYCTGRKWDEREVEAAWQAWRLGG